MDRVELIWVLVNKYKVVIDEGLMEFVEKNFWVMWEISVDVVGFVNFLFFL